jgi:hypothetical protein
VRQGMLVPPPCIIPYKRALAELEPNNQSRRAAVRAVYSVVDEMRPQNFIQVCGPRCEQAMPMTVEYDSG